MASLEEKEVELFKQFHPLPNGPEREKKYREWKKIYDAITAS